MINKVYKVKHNKSTDRFVVYNSKSNKIVKDFFYRSFAEDLATELNWK